jgi:hypothetical protein
MGDNDATSTLAKSHKRRLDRDRHHLEPDSFGTKDFNNIQSSNSSGGNPNSNGGD